MSVNKQAQLLVQITGVIRNLANRHSNFKQLLNSDILSQLFPLLDTLSNHNELMYNICRILRYSFYSNLPFKVKYP